MGSSTIIDNTTMADDKKNPIKSILKNIKCKLGLKKEKEQKTHGTKENKKEINKEIQHKKPEVKVEDVLENFRKLEIENRKESEKKEEEEEFNNFSFKTVVDNEQENFTYNVVEEDRSRTESFQSDASNDSGFSDKDVKSEEISKEDDDVIKTEDDIKAEAAENANDSCIEDEQKKNEQEVIDSLQNLKIEDGKKKKAQLVPVARGPVRHRAGDLAGSCHPYRIETQINTTINKHTFSGGQVIVSNRNQEFQFPIFENVTNEVQLQSFSENLESRGVGLDGLVPVAVENDPNEVEFQNFLDNLDSRGVQLDGLVPVAVGNNPNEVQLQSFLDNLDSRGVQLDRPAPIPFDNVPYDEEQSLQCFSANLESRGVRLDGLAYDFEDIQELIAEKELEDKERKDKERKDKEREDILKELMTSFSERDLDTITTIVGRINETEQNPIEEFENTNHFKFENIEKDPYIAMYPTPPSAEATHSPNNEFYSNSLTPPRSDTIPSPMSDHIYPTSSNSECVLSPNSDCEKYQEILPYYEESITEDFSNCEEGTDKKARERNTSTSSLTMKNFKDMQKELSNSFSEKECCQMNRKSCRELFQEYLKSLKAEERRSMCLKVSSMDLKTMYGVLHHILLGLSGCEVDESLHLSPFTLLCEKTLGIKSQVFLENFGLELLKAATLRCPKRPLLVRYLVQCVQTARKHNPALVEGKEYLFKEVDAQGDTLVTACARAGDEYADVLAELVRREHDQVALFNVDHVNTEGYTALHVACREHSASSPRLRTVHVLLEHGGADIWKGDCKGGDTAVHMAVNAAQCSLRLVLLLFKHLDRKQWKQLAHKHNRSSVTPLDYARCAAKSTTRTNYPSEVLEFLKKCR